MNEYNDQKASMQDNCAELLALSAATKSLSVSSNSVPVLVCLYGSPGAGKTSIGQALEAEFPSKCCFVSVGEEMRLGNKLSAIEIIQKAIADGSSRGCQYIVADAQFTSQNLLDLIDLEQSELVSAALALIIDTKLEDCKETMKGRKRNEDIAG